MMVETELATEPKVRKLPPEGLYVGQVDRVTYLPNQEWVLKDGTNIMSNKLTLVWDLLGTSDQNDGQYNFGIFQFLSTSKYLRFKNDQGSRLTKAGKIIEDWLLAVPSPWCASEEVDWDAIAGCYGTLFVSHKPPNAKGDVWPTIDFVKPPKDPEHIVFNKDRAKLIFRGRENGK